VGQHPVDNRRAVLLEGLLDEVQLNVEVKLDILMRGVAAGVGDRLSPGS
jgi:hypothetical protein